MRSAHVTKYGTINPMRHRCLHDNKPKPNIESSKRQKLHNSFSYGDDAKRMRATHLPLSCHFIGERGIALEGLYLFKQELTLYAV